MENQVGYALGIWGNSFVYRNDDLFQVWFIGRSKRATITTRDMMEAVTFAENESGGKFKEC